MTNDEAEDFLWGLFLLAFEADEAMEKHPKDSEEWRAWQRISRTRWADITLAQLQLKK